MKEPRKVSRFAAMSSQTSHARWRLHILATDDSARRNTVVTLAAGATLLGRDPDGTGEKISINDRLLSRTHATMVVRGPGKRVELVDHDSRNGCWCDGVRVQGTAWVAEGAILRFGGVVAVLESDGGLVPDGLGPSPLLPGLSATARQLRDRLEMAAGDDDPILIVGQPATGRLNAARLAHELATRFGKLIVVDAGTIADREFELAMFGAVAGTVSETREDGYFQRAHNGTLVLKNVEQLHAMHQVKLLRAIEERLVYPVGGDAPLPIDVRVVACARTDLREQTQSGQFHRSLSALLRRHELHMPPLAQRLPDLIELANTTMPPPSPARSWSAHFDADAVEVLLLQPWTDNINALREVIDYATMRLEEGRSGVDLLPLALVERVQKMVATTQSWSHEPAPAVGKVSRAESRPDAHVLRELMERHTGNLGAVARELGAHRRQVYRWLDYAGVSRKHGAD